MALRVLMCRLFNHVRRGYHLAVVEDYPEDVSPNTIYIIGICKKPQYAVFMCPCGCGRIVELNLNRETSPSWRITWHCLGTISFSPSIWRKDGCRSHFFLKKNSVIWCP